MKIKICGIKNKEELKVAVNSGANAVGFIIHTTHYSADEISPEQAEKIEVPTNIHKVLVTHSIDHSQMVETAKQIKVTIIQTHGEITDDTLRLLWKSRGGLKIIKTIHIEPYTKSEEVIDKLLFYKQNSHAILLDTRTKNKLGGTGLTHNWAVSKKITTESHLQNLPVILAGGLNINNLFQAIEQVRPYAVDVNTGSKKSGETNQLLATKLCKITHEHNDEALPNFCN